MKDGAACIVLKLGIDTPIVQWAAKFFRYLLKKSEAHSSHPPIIIFVHSQGAIISEHALELLKPSERNKIRPYLPRNNFCTTMLTEIANRSMKNGNAQDQ